MNNITFAAAPDIAPHLAEVQRQIAEALGEPATLEDALNSIIRDHFVLNGGAAVIGLTLPEMIEELTQGALVLSYAPSAEIKK